jgi:glycosyltransferase involved in cell wall biosynthesis
VFEQPRLRVLSIAHTAVSREAGRLRYHPLAGMPGVDVHLVVPSRWEQFGRVQDADPPTDPGITVHVLPIRLPRVRWLKWYLHFYPGLPALVRELKPDVIHLWEEPWSAVALQAAWVKRDAALVMEVDQNILKRLPPPFETIRRYVLRRTSLVLSRSADATLVVRATGYQGAVSSIGYGVDQSRFHPKPAPPARAEGFRIGYVGRLVEEKGLDDALDALAASHKSVTLAIMGEGPYEERLRERATRLGLADRVTIQGWAAQDKVASFIQGIDALVLLTRTTRAVREQFGRVIVEAQSCGVPVIGSECGAIPNVIGDGGWVIPERAPAALAHLLEHLRHAPAEVAERAEAGRANVASRFTYDAVADQLARGWRTAWERSIAKGVRSILRRQTACPTSPARQQR